MSALDIAEQHLNEALSRLEQALAHRLAAADPHQATAMTELEGERNALRDDIVTLREQCERLSSALQAAEQDRDMARQMTSVVAAKLDVSIEELDRLIEE